MALRRMFDAAYPASVLHQGVPAWEVVAGYIGGNTPHVWTDAEWDTLTGKAGARFRLPIFTRSHDGDPNADARAAVSWLRTHGVPPDCCVALDFETRVDAAYLRAFDWIVQQAGYLTMLYGSRDYVLRNPKPSGGYWVADYTGQAHLYPGSAATQWSGSGPFGGAYDPNVVADATPLWQIGAPMSAAGPEHWDTADVGRFRELLSSWFAGGTLAEQGVNNVLDLPAAFVATQPLVQGIAQAVHGITVTLDLSQASPEQVDALASAIAGHLAVKGVSYAGTIQLDPKPA
jgi:hypothetical protein